MWSDWWVWVIAVCVVIQFPFAVLFLAKLVSYGWAAGQHKFNNRRKDRGS